MAHCTCCPLVVVVPVSNERVPYLHGPQNSIAVWSEAFLFVQHRPQERSMCPSPICFHCDFGCTSWPHEMLVQRLVLCSRCFPQDCGRKYCTSPKVASTPPPPLPFMREGNFTSEFPALLWSCACPLAHTNEEGTFAGLLVASH